MTVRTSSAENRLSKAGLVSRLDISSEKDGNGVVYTLVFDMNARLSERKLVRGVVGAEEEAGSLAWGARRHQFVVDGDLGDCLPETPYATVLYGPLVLAKCARLGAHKPELKSNTTVNGLGYAVRLKPIDAASVYAPFDVELTAPGRPTVKTRACAYESAGDDPAAKNGYIFSVRF